MNERIPRRCPGHDRSRAHATKTARLTIPFRFLCVAYKLPSPSPNTEITNICKKGPSPFPPKNDKCASTGTVSTTISSIPFGLSYLERLVVSAIGFQPLCSKSS